MKKLLITILLLLNFGSFAQDKEKIKDSFWGKDDAYKSANSIPEKWKNESAVIIYKYEFYDYHKFGKNVNFISAIRKRIKVQDEAAVKEFSEFSFKNKFYSNKGFYALRKGTNTIGVKIIKPDGKEIEIDVDKDAKKVDDESKLAIQNLEIGDIIDYYYHSEEPFKSFFDYGFTPEESTLGDIYPIMNMKLKFNTENDFFVNFNTYNGAPDLIEIPTDKSGERSYELTAKDLEKNDFPRWFLPLVELPCYKFQVFFARSGKFEKMADAFLSEKEQDVKKTVSKDDVFNYYNDKFRPFGDLMHIERFLKKKTFVNDEEKITELFYFARHHFYTQYIEASVINEAKIFYPFDLYKKPIFLNNETEFINYFMAILKDNKIDYDLIVATDRNNGSIDDLLIQRNLNVLLKINTPNPIYIEYYDPYSIPNQLSYNLENTKAFALQVSKRKKIVDAENILLPSSTIKDNVSKVNTTVSFTDDFSSLKVNRKSSYTGHFKKSSQKEKMNFYDFVDEDYQKYETEPLIDRVGNKKKQEQYRKEFEALIAKFKEKQKEQFAKELSEEFDFKIEEVDFKVKNTGRFGKKSAFEFEENFIIKNNLIKKAGENYIIEIGKIITAQVEIEKKELDRKNNIYTNFPKSLENEIEFEIPAGYTVSGIEKLNKTVENETGGFISNATISGNKLIIKTAKLYKNYFEPNKNWNKMVLFLDAAYQFTQEKILLKKV